MNDLETSVSDTEAFENLPTMAIVESVLAETEVHSFKKQLEDERIALADLESEYFELLHVCDLQAAMPCSLEEAESRLQTLSSCIEQKRSQIEDLEFAVMEAEIKVSDCTSFDLADSGNNSMVTTRDSRNKQESESENEVARTAYFESSATMVNNFDSKLNDFDSKLSSFNSKLTQLGSTLASLCEPLARAAANHRPLSTCVPDSNDSPPAPPTASASSVTERFDFSMLRDSLVSLHIDSGPLNYFQSATSNKMYWPDMLQYVTETCGHDLRAISPSVLRVEPMRVAGNLRKMGGRIKTWRQRWFVYDVNSRTLRYFADAKERVMKGIVRFAAIEDVYVDHVRACPRRSPNARLTFCVRTPLRTYFCVAPSIETMRVWIDVLLTACPSFVPRNSRGPQALPNGFD